MATSTIARPSLSDLVNASITSGVDLATLIIALDKGFAEHDAATIAESPAPMPATVTKPVKPAQTKPATKRTRKTAEVKSAPNLVATKNGGMMDNTPGSSTKGQLRKLIALVNEKFDTPLDASEIATIEKMSMAAASDYRYDLLQDLKAAA